MLPGSWGNHELVNGNIMSAATPVRPIFYPIHADHFYAIPPAIAGHVSQYASPSPSDIYTPSKRRRNENIDPATLSTTGSGVSKKRRKYVLETRTTDDKLQVVFAAIKEVKWNLSEFLHHAFQYREEDKTGIHRSRSHAAHIHPFLKGNSSYTPASVLYDWFTCPDGRGTEESDISKYLAMPYREVKPVRAALYSFALQTAENILIKEAEAAVKPSAGLHASMTSSNSSRRTHWADIGSATVSHVAEIMKNHQPLMWHYAMKIAEPKPRVRMGVTIIRQNRPAHGVVTNAISALMFCRSENAQLLPLARGMLYFASSAPSDLYNIGSRLGDTPVYSTVYNTMWALSNEEAGVIQALGSDPTKWGILRIDNVQNYLPQQDQRIGRGNKMNIGLAGTYMELEDIDIEAYSLDDKRKRIAENKRSTLSTAQVLGFIDQKHLEVVGVLQWLRTLTNFIPELHDMKAEVSLRYRTRGAKLRIPVHRSKLHPLATSGKNETITGELKDALLDFFEQLGQTQDKYIRRLILMGGDGLTYEKFLLLKKYLQFHKDEFQSFEVIEPILELWHTTWTDLSRLYECHWPAGSPDSQDPSTLGHSARLIGRKAPPNLKKVDYYPGVQLAYDVLDARMLDCWRIIIGCSGDLFMHFRDLGVARLLPSFEKLEILVVKLYRTYSSTRGYYHALLETSETTSNWSAPHGSPWLGLSYEASSTEEALHGAKSTGNRKHGTSAAKKRQKANTSGNEESEEPFLGDRVLARSVGFMRDSIISREASYAIADGDVGRAYEAIKVMLITFAGSTHSKYVTYLLETIVNFELECGPKLRDAILKSLLVNLSGKEGGFSAGDFIQEYFNRLLEAAVQRKGVDYGACYSRDVISRNLHHLARLKMQFRDGVGLARRSGKHANPHMRPEIVTLLAKYKELELHLRRPGRSIEPDDTDQFNKGITKLEGGKLQSWVTETTRSRAHKRDNGTVNQYPEKNGTDSDTGEAGNDSDDGEEGAELSHGSMQMVDGELIIETSESFEDDMEQIAGSFAQFLSEETHDNEMGSDASDDR